MHVLAPPPLKQRVLFYRDNDGETRASVSCDSAAKFRKTAFGQSAFSVRAAEKNGNVFLTISENAQALVLQSNTQNMVFQYGKTILIVVLSTYSIERTKSYFVCTHAGNGSRCREPPMTPEAGNSLSSQPVRI